MFQLTRLAMSSGLVSSYVQSEDEEDQPMEKSLRQRFHATDDETRIPDDANHQTD